jgi:uncharacterized protein YjiS (DUF1127 family)
MPTLCIAFVSRLSVGAFSWSSDNFREAIGIDPPAKRVVIPPDSELSMRRWVVHVLTRLVIAATCTNSAAAHDAQIAPGKCFSSCSNSLENLVSNSVESTNRIARWPNVPSDEEIYFDLHDKRGIAYEELTRTRPPVVTGATSVSDVMPVTDRQETSLWSSVIKCLMQGFALSGASMHPTTCPAVVFDSDEKKTPQRREFILHERRGAISSVWATASRRAAPGLERDGHQTAPPGSVVAFAEDGFREFDGTNSLHSGQPNRWNWLASSWKGVVILWADVRREREIKKAIAALAELDDRTLRDIGIPHRSRIEQVVRYGRDC